MQICFMICYIDQCQVNNAMLYYFTEYELYEPGIYPEYCLDFNANRQNVCDSFQIENISNLRKISF
jgi:hypothetical protein